MDFVDIDHDGDWDLYLSNTSAVAQQSNRWWINMGGAQGGSPGFYQDQTAARWVGLGGPGSSVPASNVLAGGGFIDFSSDADFGDFDGDGDADLFHSSVGPFKNGLVPMRVFLNDGGGLFVEFNPGGYVPSSAFGNGSLGIWCEGVQQANTLDTTGAQCDIAENVVDSDLADSDGDLDLDAVVCGDGGVTRPRVYHDRAAENGGALGFRDMTGFALATYAPLNGKYEQEWGDLDDDGDVDLYGVNWGASFADVVWTNNGSGVYAFQLTLPTSNSDDEEADFLDFDADGDLDVYVAAFAGQDRLYRNTLIGGAGFSFTNATTELPSNLTNISRDADCGDADGDGDADVFVANSFAPGYYVRNVTQIADTRAPRVPRLEQAPNRAASSAPTVVRAHVFDNQPDYMTAFADVSLEWSNGGPFSGAPMTWMGGQLFRGEIAGALHGLVSYRVRATDRQGNAGVSATLSYVSDAGGVPYCTAGTTANGCVASMTSSGVASVAASTGFLLNVANVPGQANGIVFYGASGRLAQPWAGGASSSFLCVHFPVQRTGLQASGGTSGACNGALVLDWRAYLAANPGALGNPLTAGQQFDAQAWFRDPPSPGGTSLSNALEFFAVP
jgi:hypothetical protein